MFKMQRSLSGLRGPFRDCQKTRAWRREAWIPACAGMTWLDLEALSNAVIPAKAGIHEFSHTLFQPPSSGHRNS